MIIKYFEAFDNIGEPDMLSVPTALVKKKTPNITSVVHKFTEHDLLKLSEQPKTKRNMGSSRKRTCSSSVIQV